ncbi:MAG: histidine--tRNA ligase [Bacteroidota bacterium]
MAQKPSIPKGTRDFLPEVMLRREYIFDTIRTVFRKYGYAPIETPAMENLAVLTGKYGEEGDRLIFKILNSGDYFSKRNKQVVFPEDMALGEAKFTLKIAEKALRYDLTVPFARFVVQHQNELTFPFKRYQIQPVWRADRPQKGRYREFYQCDADVVGSDSLLFDAEFIAIYDEVLSRLGLPGFTIKVNNRKILSGYAEAIGHLDKFTPICVAIDKLDKIGQEGVGQELARADLPAKDITRLFELITFEGDAKAKLAFLEEQLAGSEEGRLGVSEMKEVFSWLSYFELARGTVEFDLQLARGLNYYTGTIYEVKAQGVNIGSICGGGRYADLTGVFGKPGLSGIGISFGADRIYDVMDELGLFPDSRASSSQVLLINFGSDTLPANLKVLTQLRQAGIAAELYPDSAKLKKQFTYADRLGIPYTLVIGSEEIANEAYQLKDMQSGEQAALSVDQIIERLS